MSQSLDRLLSQIKNIKKLVHVPFCKEIYWNKYILCNFCRILLRMVSLLNAGRTKSNDLNYYTIYKKYYKKQLLYKKWYHCKCTGRTKPLRYHHQTIKHQKKTKKWRRKIFPQRNFRIPPFSDGLIKTFKYRKFPGLYQPKNVWWYFSIGNW